MTATLFDFDGVLVDSEPTHLAAFNDVLASHGLSISEKDYLETYMALDDAGVFRAVLSRGGRTLREEEVRSLVAAKNPRFMARFEQTFRTFPGAAELVARRATRGPVAIVSGALGSEIEFALTKMGIRDLIQVIVSADRVPTSKPDPGPFLLALAELQQLRGAHARVHAAAIEDSPGGVLAAKRAGLRCVAVTHTSPAASLAAAGADAVVADLGSVTDALLEGGA
jgi:beta-phosphoglucomutase-like phosphatase (HAD superfamily)